MSQNSVTSPPPQGPRRNDKSITFVDVFLTLDQQQGLWIAASYKRADGRPAIETGGYYSPSRIRALDPGERHHASAALYPPGLQSRDETKALCFPFLVIDDVGHMGPGGTTHVMSPNAKVDIALFDELVPTSWRMLTSFGNHQFGFHFEPPLTPDETRLLHRAIKQQFPALAVGLHSPGQYFRLPSGINSKPGRGDFHTKLVSLGRSYTLDEFCRGLGISFDKIALPTKKAASVETCSVETMKAMLDALDPNDALVFRSREEWVGVAHAIQNTLGADGEDLWLEWSGRYNGPAKPGEAERVWQTLPPDHKNDLGTLRAYLIAAHGETSATFVKLRQMTADDQAPLTPIDPADIPTSPAAGVSPDARREDAAKKRFDDLLKEARRLTPIPGQHRGDDDPNWLDKDGEAVGILSRTAVPTAPATIFTPHVKGLLSLLAGPPGKHKSTLALQQGLAVVWNEQKLIRDGKERLAFPGDVFYVSNEDALPMVQARAHGFIQRHGLRTKPTSFEFFPVSSRLMARDSKGQTAIQCERIVEAMVKRLKKGGRIAMLFVDTLPASTTGFNENSAEMMEVLNLLKAIAHAFWCSVVIIHHGTKATWDDPLEGRSLSGVARGWGGITGDVRGLVTMVDPTEGPKGEKTKFRMQSDDRVVAEFLVKNSYGRQNEVACFYKVETETIDMLDRETGLPTKETVPILEPWGTPHAFSAVITSAEEDAMLDKLRAAKGPFRLHNRSAKHGDKGVHEVLGTTIAAAVDIIEALAQKKRVVIQCDVRDQEAHRKFDMVHVVPDDDVF